MVTDLTGEDPMKTDMVLTELCLSMLEEALITNSGCFTAGTTNMVLKLWANNGAGTRQFHASGTKHYGDDYLHAEHMYNVQGMKNRKLKVFLGSFGSLALGIMVPVWAVQYQMKKQGGL